MKSFLRHLVGYGSLGYLGYVIYLSALIYLGKSEQSWSDLSTHYYIIGSVILFLIILFSIPVKSSEKANK